jgi:hypothetical protein
MCYKPLEEKIDKLEVELSSLKTFLYGLLNNSALPTYQLLLKLNR